MTAIDDVKAVLAAYARAVNEQDADAYVALYDDDPVWAMPGRGPLRSQAEIREAIAAQFGRSATPPMRLRITPERIDVDGSSAVVVAHPVATSSSDGGEETTVADLTAMFVLRKRPDGWRIARQVVNSRV